MQCIDESILLLPNVENINFHGNELNKTQYFESLLRLTVLDLSKNKFENLNQLRVGNVANLNLSENNVKCLGPLSKCLGLISLNMTMNKTSSLDEIKSLNVIPMLESLDLLGNPISLVPDYRSQVLGRLPKRISDIMLDNVIPCAKEIEMGLVVAALEQAKVSDVSSKSNESGRSLNLHSNPGL